MNLALLFLLVFISMCDRIRCFTPQPVSRSNSRITVLGSVYCDICSNNTFSRHSYFLAGADVKIDCKFNVLSPRTTEQISFSVKRTTNKFGTYSLAIPAVDGIHCAEEPAMESACQASLLWSPASSCSVPGYKTTTGEISIKSRTANLCIYSLTALTYRPSKMDVTLCGKT